jgi:SAM-dependent methyltransferase
VKNRPADDAERLFVANNLAVTLKESAGDNDGALLLMEEVLAVRRRMLGDEHPDTLDSVTNLALQHNEMGNFDAALPLAVEAVESARRTLGEKVLQSAEALVSISCLGAVHNSLRNFDLARALHEEALSARRQLLGDGHLECMNSTHLLGLSVFGQGEHQAGLELLERAAAQARKVLGESHPSSRHFAASLEDTRARRREALARMEMGGNGPNNAEVRDGDNGADGTGITARSASVDALRAVVHRSTPLRSDLSVDDLLDVYIGLKRALDECVLHRVEELGTETEREVYTRAKDQLGVIIDAADAAAGCGGAADGDGSDALVGQLAATRVHAGSGGKKGGKKGGKGRNRGGKKKRADEDWEADAAIVNAQPGAGAQEGGGGADDDSSLPTNLAAARIALLAKARVERDAAAGGFTSMRTAYDELGAGAYYEAHGAEYTNPHEPTVVAALSLALDGWRGEVLAAGPLLRGLDLGCGSGEASHALAQWSGAAGCEIVAADPYTYEAYEKRMGQPAERWSFEDVAGGILDELPPFDICLGSFTLHLIEPSYLYTTLAALARSVRLLVVVTPHKRPIIDASTGWRAFGEIVHERVRVRLYVADGARRPEAQEDQAETALPLAEQAGG